MDDLSRDIKNIHLAPRPKFDHARQPPSAIGYYPSKLSGFIPHLRVPQTTNPKVLGDKHNLSGPPILRNYSEVLPDIKRNLENIRLAEISQYNAYYGLARQVQEDRLIKAHENINNKAGAEDAWIRLNQLVEYGPDEEIVKMMVEEADALVQAKEQAKQQNREQQEQKKERQERKRRNQQKRLKKARELMNELFKEGKVEEAMKIVEKAEGRAAALAEALAEARAEARQQKRKQKRQEKRQEKR